MPVRVAEHAPGPVAPEVLVDTEALARTSAAAAVAARARPERHVVAADRARAVDAVGDQPTDRRRARTAGRGWAGRRPAGRTTRRSGARSRGHAATGAAFASTRRAVCRRREQVSTATKTAAPAKASRLTARGRAAASGRPVDAVVVDLRRVLRRPARVSPTVVGPWGRSRSLTVDTDFPSGLSRSGASSAPRGGAPSPPL